MFLKQYLIKTLVKLNKLLRINFLGSQKRYDFWQQFPPDGLYVLSKRPSFTGKGTDSIDYAWFVWSDIKELQGIHWIK